MTHHFQKKTIMLACLIISIAQLSMGLVFPALPWIAQSFTISIDQAQLLVSVYLLGFGPSQFIYGPISDALGRKKVLFFGLLLATLGLVVIITFVDSFNMMLLGRFLQGLGTGCCAVLARASTRDSYSADQLHTALSYIAIVASFTPLLAPIIGGFINYHFGWSMVFVTLLGYLILTSLVLSFSFEETIHEKRKVPKIKEMLSHYQQLLTSGYFVNFASIAWLNFSLVVTSLSLMPFVLQNQLGMTSDEFALWTIIPACGMLLGTLMSNRLRPRLGMQKTLALTPSLQLIAASWLILCPVQPLWLMLGQFIMVFANGLALPCAQTMIMQPYKKRAGLAAAMSGGGQMIFASIISFTLMALGLNQPWHLGLVIAVFALITYANIKLGFNREVPAI